MPRNLRIARNAIWALLYVGPISSAQTPVRPAFEVASIKPAAVSTADGGAPGVNHLEFTKTRVFGSNVTARRVILDAFHISPVALNGGPKWIESERFDIDARVQSPAQPEELRQMLQTLLAERFHLMAHRESRMMRSYVLTIEDERKLHPLKDGEVPSAKDLDALGVNDPMDDPNRLGAGIGLMIFRGTIDEFTNALSANRDIARPVVDESGKDGRFLFALKYYRSDLLADLQRRYGLRFRSEEAMVDMLIVDRIEKPSAN